MYTNDVDSDGDTCYPYYHWNDPRRYDTKVEDWYQASDGAGGVKRPKPVTNKTSPAPSTSSRPPPPPPVVDPVLVEDLKSRRSEILRATMAPELGLQEHKRLTFPVAEHRKDLPQRLAFFAPLRSEPVETLGELSLPDKVISRIVAYLHVSSALNLAQVNRLARASVVRNPCIALIKKHADAALCAVLRGGFGTYIRVLDVYSALTTRNCRFCSRAGKLMLIPQAARCCVECVTSRVHQTLYFPDFPGDWQKFVARPGLKEDRLTYNMGVPANYGVFFPLRISVDHVYWGLDPSTYPVWRERDLCARIGVAIYMRHVTPEARPAIYMPHLITPAPSPDDDRGPDVVTSPAQYVFCAGCGVFRTGCEHWDMQRDTAPSVRMALKRAVYERTRENLDNVFLEHFKQCRAAQNLWTYAKGLYT